MTRYQRAVVSLPLPVNRPDHWTEAASCAGPDVEAEWFDAPHDGESHADRTARINRAKAVCARCPVRVECADAIVPGDSGVRGGHLIGKQLYGDVPKAPAKGGRPREPIEHGGEKGARAHYRRGEKACRRCLDGMRVAKADRKARREAS